SLKQNGLGLEQHKDTLHLMHHRLLCGGLSELIFLSPRCDK
ncbi:14644_t:CDS:1, partial [Cetraspora pellucida]